MTCAAVRVDGVLGAGEARQLDGLAVQHLGLRAVHLVERLRRDAEAQPAQLVQDEAGAVEHLLALAEHHVGLALVDVLHHRGDERAAAHQLAAEALCAGELLAVGDQRDQHLAGGVAHAHHGVAHEAGAAVLVVGWDAEPQHKAAHRADDLLGLGVLDQAFPRVDDAVRAGGVHAAQDVALRGGRAAGALAAAVLAGRGLARRAGGERGHHLVAIGVRVPHAQDGTQRLGACHLGKQLGHTLVFRRKLLVVGLVDVLAGAALARNRALRQTACRHVALLPALLLTPRTGLGPCRLPRALPALPACALLAVFLHELPLSACIKP